MKFRKVIAALGAILCLGGCANYDQQTHDEVGQVLDGATQILQLVIQGVQTFGGR